MQKNDEVIEKVAKISKSWILLDMQVQSPTQKDGRTNKGRR